LVHEVLCQGPQTPSERTVTVLPDTFVNVSPPLLAAVLLASRSLCQHFALPCASAEAILTATDASRTRAYELVAALLAALPTLVRPPGRPARPPPDPLAAPPPVAREVLRFVMQHPGCVHNHGVRQRYSDGFRHFVVGLRAQHESVPLDVFAALAELPVGTLKSWLSPNPCPAVPTPEPKADTTAGAQPSGPQDPMLAQIETVLTAWKTWDGTFVGFAEHVRTNLRVPFGTQLVARVLEQSGVRLPRRRPGRSPDELALRGAFETFFPGAQWVGDGKKVTVVLGGQSFDFNFELDVDAHTGAWVGLSVRDTEDSKAVTETFADGVSTTGAAPLALLLDNRPSNHTPEVDEALDPTGTLRMRATPVRPQNKAHVEGAFGLFAQSLPPLVLDTKCAPRAVALQLAVLIATTFARAINRRPRADRGDRSRADLYADSPTDAQIAAAKAALEERCRLQELARATREARERPEVRALLDTHFARLGLTDPDRHVRLAIAAYTLDAIVDGIAIFDGKRRAGTLPDGADARYLLGIVRNVQSQRENEHVADALLALRLEARDQALAALVRERSVVCGKARDDLEIIADCVDRALVTDRSLDRRFWLAALADQILQRAADLDQQRRLYAAAARRIGTTFRVSPRERQDAVRSLADRLVPLD
jgi:hypothetical protein